MPRVIDRIASIDLKRFGLAAGPLLLLTALVLPESPQGNGQASVMVGIALLMAVWWFTEAVPMAITALLPLVLFPLAGLGEPRDLVGHYFSPIIPLLLAGFLLAVAMERWDLHRRFALAMLSRAGTAANRLILSFLLASAALSMWISNTATVAMMLPIALAVVSQMERSLGASPSHRLATGILLAVCYGASLGGIATPVGTPTNLAFMHIARESFPNSPPISFSQWMMAALPLSAVMLLAAASVLIFFARQEGKDAKLDPSFLQKERDALGPLKPEEKRVAFIFALTALLWIFRKDLHLGFATFPGWSRLWTGFQRIDDGSTGIAMILLLFVLPSREGRLLDKQALARVPWDVMLLLGGGFALAAGFRVSGLTEILANAFLSDNRLPIWAGIAIACLFVTFFTELTSNTATVQICLPILAAWAIASEVNPFVVMAPAAISASLAFMLPVATPPNAIIYGSQRITIPEMAKRGLVLNLCGVAVATALALWILPMVLGGLPLPAWAHP